VLISVQDRCMICSECTTGMEIVLGLPDGTPSDMGQLKVHFGPFGHSVNLNAI
jgi:hypothetical protein